MKNEKYNKIVRNLILVFFFPIIEFIKAQPDTSHQKSSNYSEIGVGYFISVPMKSSLENYFITEFDYNPNILFYVPTAIKFATNFHNINVRFMKSFLLKQMNDKLFFRANLTGTYGYQRWKYSGYYNINIFHIIYFPEDNFYFHNFSGSIFNENKEHRLNINVGVNLSFKLSKKNMIYENGIEWQLSNVLTGKTKETWQGTFDGDYRYYTRQEQYNIFKKTMIYSYLNYAMGLKYPVNQWINCNLIIKMPLLLYNKRMTFIFQNTSVYFYQFEINFTFKF